jgi:hypothetical protein
MYIGSAWIGFAIFMLFCWILSTISAQSYVQQGYGDVDNFRLLLVIIPIFGFAIPMLVGIRTLRRAGQQAREQESRREP